VSTKSMLPTQAPSIDRTPSGAAAFVSNAGVEASSFWDVLGDVGKAAASAGLNALGGAI